MYLHRVVGLRALGIIPEATQQPVDLSPIRAASKDESASHRYDFPIGFTLLGGETVAIRTGCEIDSEGPSETGTDLFWCWSSAIWNNDGDTAFLLDDSGNIVDSRSY